MSFAIKKDKYGWPASARRRALRRGRRVTLLRQGCGEQASDEQARNVQELSIRNLDVIDLGRVSGSSNFLEMGSGMEDARRDGEREKLKFFPIRKLYVVNCEGLRVF